MENDGGGSEERENSINKKLRKAKEAKVEIGRGVKGWVKRGVREM